jgi:hypothetical protein
LDTLPRLLDSLLAQGLSPAELTWVVVDDHSTDGTAEWLESTVATAGLRLEWIRSSDYGPGAARNAGIGVADAPWVAFADADDTLEALALSRWLEQAERQDIDLLLLEQPASVTGRSRALLGDVARTTTPDQLWDGEWLRPWAPYSKLVARRLLDDPAVRFGRTLEAEDLTFYVRAVTRSRRISFAPGLPRYVYASPSTSAMTIAPKEPVATLAAHEQALTELVELAPNRAEFIRGASPIIAGAGAALARGLAHATTREEMVALRSAGESVFESVTLRATDLAHMYPRERAVTAFGLACVSLPAPLAQAAARRWVAHKARAGSTR